MNETELEKLLSEYARNHALLKLGEFEETVQRILKDMEEARDRFIEVLNATARVLSEQDKQVWEKAITEALENTSTGENSGTLGTRHAKKRLVG
jgi:hypothetical protein